MLAQLHVVFSQLAPKLSHDFHTTTPIHLNDLADLLQTKRVAGILDLIPADLQQSLEETNEIRHLPFARPRKQLLHIRFE